MTAVFCPSKYNGEFVTLHYWGNEWGYQVTQWQFGKPKMHWYYSSIMSAMMDVLQAGFNWANPKMQNVFEKDVILAGE